MSKTD